MSQKDYQAQSIQILYFFLLKTPFYKVFYRIVCSYKFGVKRYYLMEHQ